MFIYWSGVPFRRKIELCLAHTRWHGHVNITYDPPTRSTMPSSLVLGASYLQHLSEAQNWCWARHGVFDVYGYCKIRMHVINQADRRGTYK